MQHLIKNRSALVMYILILFYLCSVSKGCLDSENSELQAEIIPNEPEQVMLLREKMT